VEAVLVEKLRVPQEVVKEGLSQLVHREGELTRSGGEGLYLLSYGCQQEGESELIGNMTGGGGVDNMSGGGASKDTHLGDEDTQQQPVHQHIS